VVCVIQRCVRVGVGFGTALAVMLSVFAPGASAAPGAPAVPRQEPGGAGWALLGGRASVAGRLVASDPPVYAQDYLAAESYLLGLLGPNGEASADPEAQAWIALALDENGQPGAAARAEQWLVGTQAADGSWGGEAGATGIALWALAEHARLTGDVAALRADWPAIRAGAGYLVGLEDPMTGDIPDQAGGAVQAFPMGEALIGLQAATAAAGVLGHAGSARMWLRAADAAAGALDGDVRIARSASTDYFANALFDPGTGSLVQRREVAGVAALSLTYPGWGVKFGPGYFDSMDWVGAEPTFLYVLAAVWNGLPGAGGVQYDPGLRLQCGNGEIAYQYHPPVGPQTGGFQSGANCNSPQTSPEFTAMYLMATHALLGLRGSGDAAAAEPHLPAPWVSATVAVGGRTLTLHQKPGVDPTVPFHRRRVAVVVGTSNGNEGGLEMGVAYEALLDGYVPWVFWYLNNDYGPLHNLYNLFHNLSRYTVIVVGHDALYGPTGGAYRCSGGACPNPTPLTWFQSQAPALASWLAAGGRLVTTGDRTALPLTGTLEAGTAAASAPITQVAFTAAARSLTGGPNRLGTDALSGLSPGAATYYDSVGPAYTVLATGQDGGGAVPVMIGAEVGRGRVLQTTVGLSSAAHDVGPAVAKVLAWALSGLPAQPAAPQDPGRLASGATAAIMADWWDASATLFTAPPRTQDRCGSGYSAVWPVSQVYALAGDLPAGAQRAQVYQAVYQALPHYWEPTYLGVGAFTACTGGGTAYYDDNGWILNDMLVQYQQAPTPALLSRSEALFRFLETGWRPGVGGEEFHPGCNCAEQVATGNFLDAALRLYLITRRASYLTWAQTIYAWEQAHMQAGPDGNGLYYDLVKGSGDTVTGFHQYTYDTGVVLQADVLFYRATGDPSYLRAGERLAAAASAAFVDPASGVLESASASGPAFDAIYLRGARMLAQADGNEAWLAPARGSARAAVLWDAQAGGGGTTYGQDWSGVNTWYDAAHMDVLTQAGTAGLFALLARASAEAGGRGGA